MGMRVVVSVVRLVISLRMAVMNCALSGALRASTVSISSVSPVWYSEANRVSMAYSRMMSVSVGSVLSLSLGKMAGGGLCCSVMRRICAETRRMSCGL